MLGAAPLDAFSGGEAPGPTQFLFPFMAGIGLMNERIPIEHRMYAVIEEFARCFILRPSGATLLIDGRENDIRAAARVRISPDDISGILADLEPQMEPHGSFRHASQDGFKRLLGAVPHLFGVVIRVDSAEFIGSNESAARHYSDVIQNVANV